MPHKKAPRTDRNLLIKEMYQTDKQRALQTLLERSNRLEQIRLRSLQMQEDCLLSLAIEILQLKEIYGCSWRELGEQFIGTCDYSTLHKLANRNIYLRRQSYERIIAGINTARNRKGLDSIDFPQWEGT